MVFETCCESQSRGQLCPSRCLGFAGASVDESVSRLDSVNQASSESGLEISFPEIHWRLTNPLDLLRPECLVSDVFLMGDVQWRLDSTAFQLTRWNGVHFFLSVHLRLHPSESRSESLTAGFTFSLWSLGSGEVHFREHCVHRFDTGNPDFGYMVFVPLDDLITEGHEAERTSCSYGLTLNFTHLKRTVPSTEAKEQTISLRSCGFPLLSLFSQSLVYIFYFHRLRKMVYEIDLPLESEDREFISALQKTFRDMELGLPGSLDIINVYQAYGYELADLDRILSFSELLQELLKRLDNCWIENQPFRSMFIGNYRYQTLGISTRMRKFDCLNLDILQREDFYQALNNCHINNDEIAIQCPSAVRQPLRRTEFHTFPSVLRLVLKRFKFDSIQRRDIKLMTYFGIPQEFRIDQTTFHSLVSSNEDNTQSFEPVNYKLFSVIVHEGNSLKSGHYVTYIRPDGHHWKRIASRTVNVPEDHVVETMTRSACFLSYVKISDWHQLVM